VAAGKDGVLMIVINQEHEGHDKQPREILRTSRRRVRKERLGGAPEEGTRASRGEQKKTLRSSGTHQMRSKPIRRFPFQKCRKRLGSDL